MEVSIHLDGKCGHCLLFGAIQGMDDGLILVDREGKIFHMNRRAEEYLELAAARMIGESLRSNLKHRGLAWFWTSALGEKGAVTTELALRPGALMRATITPCRSAAGDPIGVALLLRDVTHEKKVQVELSTSVARRLLEMAGEDEVEGDGQPLTNRERQILGLLAQGLSNAAIGAKLNVSLNTVASHLKHLYPKIEARNRSQATAYALRHGIRPPKNSKK